MKISDCHKCFSIKAVTSVGHAEMCIECIEKAQEALAKSANELKFAFWMEEVNVTVLRLCGLTMYDLPDHTWRDWYDGNTSPEEAAEMAIDEEFYDK